MYHVIETQPYTCTYSISQSKEGIDYVLVETLIINQIII